MRVIPVIDLKDGAVVRGITGRRSDYRPIESQIAKSPSPADVAGAFAKHFSFREVYVADLDAIGGADPDWASYGAIAQSGMQLWIDAGVADVKRARQLASFPDNAVEKVIVGLESIPSLQALRDVVNESGPERVIFSLDLMEGRPLTNSAHWPSREPLAIAALAVEAGCTGMIVLDLSHVGAYRGGGALDLLSQLRHVFSHVELIGGGGVRSFSDLEEFARAGCCAVLAASALHDGRLTPGDIEAAKLL